MLDPRDIAESMGDGLEGIRDPYLDPTKLREVPIGDLREFYYRSGGSLFPFFYVILQLDEEDARALAERCDPDYDISDLLRKVANAYEELEAAVENMLDS